MVAETAYLVIREESKWSDVVRLVPGRTVTIGRAPTSQVVLKDDRCSRNHAEVFMSGGQWTLRDLDSRNGTVVADRLVKSDQPLSPGDVIRIGHSQLVFVNNLSEAFADASPPVRRQDTGQTAEAPNQEGKTRIGLARDELAAAPGDAFDVGDYDPTTITHRQGRTKILDSAEKDEGGTSPMGRAAAKLCRLAFELGKAAELQKIASLALEGLFEGTKADAGGLLLLPRDFRGTPTGADLELIHAQSRTDQGYQRLPNSLAATVLREGEAVLARNAPGDTSAAGRDPAGSAVAANVLCAPVRQGERAFGIIHLYSVQCDAAPGPDDLEFALAVADTVAVAVGNFYRRQELAENLTQVRIENVQLREQLGVQSDIIGSHPLMRQVTEEIARAAATRATVLIRGESGVGKELVARAVHYSSQRSKNVFVCLNCAALSEDLLASELFGHERGAFTGATDRKIGKFEAAHLGTLMLDEIGEMSQGIQAKFLRVLEGHPFERVGGSKPIKVDVRVIAATNRDLERDVREGRFRHDLFFRLRVLEIIVPPLRKRAEDIAALANHFLAKYRLETGRKVRGFTPAATELLSQYRWPGNVRELKNVIERAVVLSTGEYIEKDDLLLSSLATTGDTGEIVAPLATFQPCSLDDMECRHIQATLKHTGWNKSRTASILGIERSTLDRKIRRYNLAEDTSPPVRENNG